MELAAGRTDVGKQIQRVGGSVPGYPPKAHSAGSVEVCGLAWSPGWPVLGRDRQKDVEEVHRNWRDPTAIPLNMYLSI